MKGGRCDLKKRILCGLREDLVLETRPTLETVLRERGLKTYRLWSLENVQKE